MYSQTVDASDVITASLLAMDHVMQRYGEELVKSATWRVGVGARDAIYKTGEVISQWQIPPAPKEATSKGEYFYPMYFAGLPARVPDESFPLNRLELIYKDQPIATIDITDNPGFED